MVLKGKCAPKHKEKSFEKSCKAFLIYLKTEVLSLNAQNFNYDLINPTQLPLRILQIILNSLLGS